MKLSLIALMCLALAACEGQGVVSPLEAAQEPALAASQRTVQLNQPFELRVGETVAVSGEPLTVKLESVPSDSRCPTGVNCVWAGNAVVRVTLSSPGVAPQTFELNTTLDPKSATYGAYTIDFTALAPYPSSTNPIAQSKYRATFVVSKTAV
ncbi:MAG TPA: hypothetical protein VF263_22175 [Longimicrobiaceae bacterium]